MGQNEARRFAIRRKVAAAMLVPLTILTLVIGVESLQIADATAKVRHQAGLATAADGPGGLLKSLQDERNWVSVELIGQGGLVTVEVEGYEETRRSTDEALEGFRRDIEGSDEQTAGAYAAALEKLTGLTALREQIDAFDAPRSIENAEFGNEMFDGYSAMITPLLDGVNAIASIVDHPELRQGADLIATSSRLVEVVANLSRRTLIYSLLSEGGVNTPAEIVELSDLNERLKLHTFALESNTTGIYDDAIDEEIFRVFIVRLTVYVGGAIDSGTVDLATFLDAVTVPNEDSYLGYRDRLGEILRTKADGLVDDATQRQRMFLVSLAAVITVAAAIAWAAAQSITSPLRSLTRQTTAMAAHHLPEALSEVLRTPLGEDVDIPRPEPITVSTRDEIATLARTVNQVQDSALGLAVGQAVLRRNLADTLVNLGRRNQNLLSRQLDLITDLERGEADPDALANLFRLDHLATRMRRNAESLLVLAEVAPSQHGAGPVRVTDVIRAALGEVEDFRRVEIRIGAGPGAESGNGADVGACRMLGAAAGDLAHLLAELVENALSFSSEQQTVEVRGILQQRGYTVMVIDGGVGMTSEDLALANRRLAGEESFTIAPSKYIGHYVVGNLARRHGIDVRLQPSPGQGVTATVQLPATLVLVPHLDGPRA